MDYVTRVDAFAAKMGKYDLDLALLFDRDNIRYFTGFRLNRVVSSILAVSRNGNTTYIVAQLDLKRAERDCWIEHVIPFPEDTPNYLASLAPLLRGSPRRIGVEKDTLTLAQMEYIMEIAGVGVEFVDVRALTAQLRIIKSEEEIACIRRAADVASRVMDKVRQEIRPDIREAELASWTGYLMVKEGAEGPSFEPFMMSGENAWLPQRVASQKALKDGELVLLDMGAVCDGYCSDITRTFAVGEVSQEQKRVFQVAWKAQQAAIEAIRPGVHAFEVDAAAREIVEAEGLAAYFPHLTGHGVGVSVHEAPILDKGVDTVLQPGMVVTVEPGVYLPRVGAARVEDMVLVTTSGCELLTSAARDLV